MKCEAQLMLRSWAGRFISHEISEQKTSHGFWMPTAVKSYSMFFCTQKSTVLTCSDSLFCPSDSSD